MVIARQNQIVNLRKVPSFIVLLLLISWNFAAAQLVDFDQMIPTLDQRAKTFEDYLVQLAWENRPERRILQSEVAIANNDIKLEKKDWSKDLQGSFNLNEISLSEAIYGDRLDVPVFYPIYNFTATVKLETLISRKQKVENAKFKAAIAEEELNAEKLKIRRDVLERYQSYLVSIEVLRIRVNAENTAYEAYNLIAERFRKGKAELDEYSKASNLYYGSQEQTKEAEANVNIAIYSIEEMIGIPLTEAQRMGPKTK